jgi:hypothetical protein
MQSLQQRIPPIKCDRTLIPTVCGLSSNPFTGMRHSNYRKYAVKAYGVLDVEIHIFLTSALVGDEWLASRPGRFTPQHPLDRRLGQPKSQSGHGKNS